MDIKSIGGATPPKKKEYKIYYYDMKCFQHVS